MKTRGSMQLAPLLLVVCVADMMGCMPPHVKIELPARDAPMEERVAAYKQYRPTSSLEVSGDGPDIESIKLGNGEYVLYPDDLLPAVEPTSPTARYAERARDYGIPSAVLSATTTLTALGYFASIIGYGITDESTYIKPLPLGLLAVSLTSFVVNALAIAPAADDARSKAFDSYDADLLERLRMQRKVHVEERASPEAVPRAATALTP